ncbi:unnamed protein product [Rotaria sp. Silwood1]|nr:unnamed protein product [Rotaria sp. Silwood1]CAF0925581.1 unnamed protein product [Rotaria sp. Silwood1]CAF3362327.1 unnamed protein product [Rotaria sp. Silwood1]CAF3385531.1 unnamed protein product [Rotaria sp. Silwood1]CAF3397151.1 unnamed protein product [Rotaria sp. Silwood1]
MNGSCNVSNFVVRLRGLPWSTTQSEILNFLRGCKVRRIQFITNDQGRSTGECFVVLETKEDIDLAKSYDKNMLGTRYIEVFESSFEAMSDMMKNINNNNSSNSQNNSSNNDNWQEPVVRLRGLPYHSSKNDVMKFFDGLDIAQNGVHISSSKPAGEAFVAFVNMDNALRALEFNRMNMGHRYIEVFKSTYAEARTSIINDTQLMVRQKTANAALQRQGNYMNNTGSGNTGSNYNDNMNQYSNDSSLSNDFDSDDRNGNNFPMSNNDSGSLKRPLAASFTMKLRGVPFEAGKKEIHDFFNPLIPIRIEQENTIRGRPPTWFVEFGSREEANEALTFHKKYLGARYIEIFPLYDDNDRSKMIRN